MERLRVFGAGGGAAFAVLVVIAFAIAPGPSSAHGETVVRYYSAHGTAVAWQAALVGIAVVLFIWFAEIFAAFVSGGSAALVGAAVTAALYLVTIGCWEALGETYNRTNFIDLGSEDFGDAHVLYDAGVGAAHLAHITTAAYVGSTAVAILASGASWRWLGWIGIVFAPVSLVCGLIVLASESHWSDDLGTVVFLVFLAWVFATSVWLVLAMRRGHLVAPAAASS
jgi:hypothetical protein